MLELMPLDNYKIQLSEYGFETWPRFAGNPSQEIVRTFDEFYKFLHNSVRQNKSVFISHNSYPLVKIKWVMTKKGEKKALLPEVITVEAILHDMDCPDKPENALADARNLIILADELGMDWMVDYSGNKGFHLIMKFDPTMYWFKFGENGHKETSADSLKILIQAIQGYMADHCILRTIDPQLFSDAKRIIRCPWTPYFKEEKWNGRYCIPLTRDQILNWNITQIIEASQHPTFEIVKSSGGDRYRMEEMISFLGASRFYKPAEGQRGKPPQAIKTDIADSVVEEILLAIKRRGTQCVYDHLRSRNPPHAIRVFFALFMMKYYGFRMGDSDQVNEVWEKFAKEFNYDDVHNYDDRIAQIESIVDNPKYQADPRPHSCDGLKTKQICYCDNALCPKYRE